MKEFTTMMHFHVKDTNKLVDFLKVIIASDRLSTCSVHHNVFLKPFHTYLAIFNFIIDRFFSIFTIFLGAFSLVTERPAIESSA